MSLEPRVGRRPQVSGNQRSQGKQKEESDDAENTVGDNHFVRLGQRYRGSVASTSPGRGRSGIGAGGGAERLGEIQGALAHVIVLGKTGVGRTGARVRGSKGPDDVF